MSAMPLAPPLLCMVGQVHLHHGSVLGTDVASHLHYRHLSDMLPDTLDACILDPTAARAPLTHRALKSFVTEGGFDLSSFGIPYGARCALLIPNGSELCVCLLACMNAYCAAPINPFSTSHEILNDCRSCRAQCMVVKQGQNVEAALAAANLLQIPVFVLRPDPMICGIFQLEAHPEFPVAVQLESPPVMYRNRDDVVLVLHTSGTSGKKKLVPYTLDMLCVGCGCIVKSWNLGPQDVNMNMMPLFHIGGIVRNLCAPIMSGGACIPCGDFDAVLFWDVLEKTGFTWYYAAPTMHSAILHEATRRIAAGKSLSNAKCVRMIANAAGGLLPVLAEQLLAMFGAVILPSYGMTECMPISSPPFNYKLDKPGSSGVPVGPQVCIFSDEGVPLAANEIGEICLKGSPCFGGYENNLDANSESFLPGGWFKTGDCGKLDEDGFLFITGRSKEIINRGGETISPMEIEQVIIQHPLVHKTMAFSAPHEHLQETVGLVVVPNPRDRRRPDLRSLLEFCQDKLHPSKWPQVLVYMTELPTTSTNKVQRIKMAERLQLDMVNDNTVWWKRTFNATCPPKGAPLTVKIQKEAISIDIEEIEKCLSSLHSDGALFEISSTVIPMLLGNDYALVACVTPIQEDVDDILRICEQTLHTYQVPKCILVLDVLPTKQKKSFIVQRELFAHDPFALYCRRGDVVVVLHEEETMWYCECEGRRGLISMKDRSFLKETQLELVVVDGQAIKQLALAQLALKREIVLPTDELEETVERLWASTLGLANVSTVENFFQIGGDSLKAGLLVSQMRASTGVWITVAELFTRPTVQGVCEIIRERERIAAHKRALQVTEATSLDDNVDKRLLDQLLPQSDSPTHQSPYSQLSGWALLVQALPLFVLNPWKRATKLFIFLSLWVILLNHDILKKNRFDSLIAAIIVAGLILSIVNPLIGIVVKWLVVGKYRAGRYPIWGSMYLRVWLVEQTLVVFGKGLFGLDIPVLGPWLIVAYYRLLGAKIGQKVSIDRNATLAQFDLLTVGDEVKIDNATVRPVALEAGYFTMLPIVISDGCSVGTKSTVVGGSTMPSDTHLGALTSTHEIHESTYANIHTNRKAYPSPPWYMPLCFGFPILVGVYLLSRMPWFYVVQLMLQTANNQNWASSNPTSLADAIVWWTKPNKMGFLLLTRFAKDIAGPIIHIFCAILLKHTVIGRFREGPRTQSWDLFRYWLMSQLIPDGTFKGITTMVGTHYELISGLYRSFGAKIGKRVYWPGSGINGIVAFDLFEVGDDVTFGSRSFISTATDSELHRVCINDGAMLADRCMLQPGVTVEKLAVMGSGSLGKCGSTYPMGSTWVGCRNNDAVMLVAADPSVKGLSTLNPFGRAFYMGLASYQVLGLGMVTAYNMCATCVRLVVSYSALLLTLFFVDSFYQKHGAAWGAAIPQDMLLYFVLFGCAMLANLSVVLCMFVYELVLKHVTVGHRVAGKYRWDQSSYCQRWQIYLAFQQRNFTEGGSAGVLGLVQGSAYLVWYFRALGCKIGKNVCLYPFGADPMMTEPELVTLGDHCSIDNASLIAHINTRGEFALNPLVVGACSVVRQHTRLVSGARVGSRSIVLEHTLIMNGEEVSDGCVCQGWPCQHIVSLDEYEAEVRYAIEKATGKVGAGSGKGLGLGLGSAQTVALGEEFKDGEFKEVELARWNLV